MKKLSDQEVEKQLEGLIGWEFIDGSIATSYEFENFKAAFSVMTRIAFECEAQNHHPEWGNAYNTLTIFLNTHDAGGVTSKDFALAYAIERIVHRK